MHKGSDFFNRNNIFDTYTSGRHRPDGPNETLENPIFAELVGDVSGQRILDLGCGDGIYGLELLSTGCESYIGLESSSKMVHLARQNLANTIGQVVLTELEEWEYPPTQFDLVVSRLTLHYVANLEDTFRMVNETLRSGGRFIFSIVHPIITSCDRSREGGGQRQDWVVDDYFVTGPRRVYFMGEHVKQFHRSIEDIFQALQDAGFTIEQLRESRPYPENFTDKILYERRRRIPLFLFLSSRKK